MEKSLTGLLKRAKEILNQNWQGRFTKPSPVLYPHQWNWDSGFIAIGYAHYNQQRAQQELDSLFSAQWTNGMLPHIVFDREHLGHYFPEPEFWQCEKSRHCPQGVLTSGITMPPVHATAALRIYRYARNREAALAWLRQIYPGLMALHEYFYRERDPLREGLVYIRHPWESGLDNSPTWDEPLHAIDIGRAAVPRYRRQDLNKGVPETQRPTDEDYDRFVYLVDLFRRARYDEKAIYQDCPFLVQDPLFNSILARANEDLVEIGELLGQDTAKIREWRQQTNRSLREKLWHDAHGVFDAFDLRNKRKIETHTASAFMPLFCGAPAQKQANRIYQFLDSNSFCAMHNDRCFSVPNYNLQGKSLEPTNYWRGPVWINTNWLLMHGLRRYGFLEKAESVRQDIIELVRRYGFHEYFDPFQGTGYGTDCFSWTAALFIDVVMEAVQD